MTTLTAPIAKLYKRCARNHHDTCPGSFETWSVCSCDCHAGVSDTRAAPLNPTKYICAICGASFWTATELDEHIRDVHAGVRDERPAPRMKMPATCMKCGRPFKGPAKRYECQCNATMPAPAAEAPVTCADKHDAVVEAIAIVSPKPARKAKASGLSTKTDKYAKWANSIVAKNTRIRIAAEESLARSGLKPAVIGKLAHRILTPRCEHCRQYMRVEWVNEHDLDSTTIIIPCGCQEKEG